MSEAARDERGGGLAVMAARDLVVSLPLSLSLFRTLVIIILLAALALALGLPVFGCGSLLPFPAKKPNPIPPFSHHDPPFSAPAFGFTKLSKAHSVFST